MGHHFELLGGCRDGDLDAEHNSGLQVSMSNERNPWDRMEGESAKWFARFSRFRMMKPWVRSVNAVFEEERKEKQGKVSTKIGKRWCEAKDQWKWEERAAAWDKSQLDERDRQIAEEEADILRKGLALKHERIKELEEKARLIEKSWQDPGKDNSVAYQWLTPDKIREWRGCLDDIASETGGRIKQVKKEVSSPDVTGAAELLFNKLAVFKQKKQNDQS